MLDGSKLFLGLERRLAVHIRPRSRFMQTRICWIIADHLSFLTQLHVYSDGYAPYDCIDNCNCASEINLSN